MKKRRQKLYNYKKNYIIRFDIQLLYAKKKRVKGKYNTLTNFHSTS